VAGIDLSVRVRPRRRRIAIRYPSDESVSRGSLVIGVHEHGAANYQFRADENASTTVKLLTAAEPRRYGERT